MRIRCIALDLDGTTLNSQGRLGGENRKALEQAVASGICIAVASGRSLDSLPAEVLAVPGIRYAITSNGAAVYDLEKGICLRQYKMSAASVQDILECTEKEDVTFEAFINGKPYAEKAPCLRSTTRPMSLWTPLRAIAAVWRSPSRSPWAAISLKRCPAPSFTRSTARK